MLLMHLLPPRRHCPQLPARYFGAGISFQFYHRTVARLHLRQNVPSITRIVALCLLGPKNHKIKQFSGYRMSLIQVNADSVSMRAAHALAIRGYAAWWLNKTA
jgi:hypothetical protein